MLLMFCFLAAGGMWGLLTGTEPTLPVLGAKSSPLDHQGSPLHFALAGGKLGLLTGVCFLLLCG